jgi:pSer/pThr/pTyr-binding forkhead associated (FHA) protein
MPNNPEPNSNATATDKALALRFISGKYQGGEYPLEDGKEIIVGRSSDLDMVLVEEMVSRRHARIVMKGGLISIQDLGSTNGTFVNGEKIRHAKLREGDRVLIGTSILKVVAVSQRQPKGSSLESVAKRRVTQRQAAAGEEAPRMTGNLQEIPLPDLMQLFGTSRKTGVLVLRTSDRVGRIWLEQGLVRHAETEDSPEVGPLKTMYRLLSWSEGLFELNPPDQRTFEDPLDASVQEILMEGFRQQDELNQLLGNLPKLGQRLILRTPLEAPLHELEPEHLDVLQQALNSASLQVLMDRTKQTDLQTAQIVRSLIDRGYLTAAD